MSTTPRGRPYTGLHPTDTEVAKTFLDILFGVVIGLIIFEYPLKHFWDKSSTDLIILNGMYFGLLLKCFFHWLGIHHDIAVLERSLSFSPTLTDYLTGLAVAAGYFFAVRLLVIWFEPPRPSWALTSLFIFLAVFKTLDVLSNQTAVPARLRRLLGNASSPALRAWYLKQQPHVMLWFFVSIPFLLAAPFASPNWKCGIVAIYLIVEVAVERSLVAGRFRIWRALQEFATDGGTT